MLGGDTRQLAIADFFINKGYPVSVWGILPARNIEKYHCPNTCKEALIDADICILPLPITADGIRLNAPMKAGEEGVRLSYLASLLTKNITVFGGKIPSPFYDELKERGVCCCDYFLNETLCIKNALLTAEAALEIAMRERDGTIDSSKTLVVGYGRIGKLLTNMLIKMNSEVVVAARRKDDLTYAECMGASGCIRIDDKKAGRGLLDAGGDFDVIFNTVPVWLFDRDLLSKWKKPVFIIDLASPPGGVDIRAARELGHKVIWALSLPGKYSPIRAGRIIAEAIYEEMEEKDL